MVGQIISVAQGKGGAGKTVVLTLIAARLIKDNAKVFILDVDPSGDALEWAEETEALGFHVDYGAIPPDEIENITPILRKIKDDYDLILVDTPGIASQATLFAVGRSDLVLIPVRPSKKDVKAMFRTYKKVLNMADNMDKEIPVFTVLSDIDKGTIITRKVRESIKENDIPLLQKEIGHLTKIREFITNGGMPEGNAAREANELVANLQIEGLLDFYKLGKKEVSHG